MPLTNPALAALIAGAATLTGPVGSFSNLNGVTFGVAGNTITASVAAGGLTNVNLSAGTTSNNLSAFVFVNSNNVSFGLNGSTVTATITAPAQTNQTAGLYALGNTTQNSSTTLDARTLSFNALGAATMGYSNGSIQVSVPVQTAQTQSNVQAIYDGANSISTGTIRFTNANGVSFSVNGQTLSGSVAAQTNQSVGLYALGNTTQNSSTTLDARTLSFNALGAATMGYSNGSIQVSVPVQTVQTQSLIAALYDGAASISTGTARFSNSNGVTFGINGQTITASHNGITSQTNQQITLYATGNTTQSSTGTSNASSLVFRGQGVASVGITNGSIVIDAPAGAPSPVNFSAGTTSSNLGSVVFSNSNGISFGLNGATITASVSQEADTFWFPYNEGINVIGQQGQATLHVMPMQAHLLKQFDRVVFPVNFSNATNSTGSITLSMWMAFYTKNDSTLSMLHSSSGSQALTFSGTVNSSNQVGIRLFSVGWTTTLTEGQYYAAVVSRSTSGGANASLSQALVSQMNSNFSGPWNAASNRSRQWPLGLGVLSVSTAGIPSSIAFSNLDGTASLVARPPSWFALSGTI